MRFLRTASTGRLLAALAAAVVVIAAGAAIAVAATGGGPVPPRRPLAQAVHRALKAPPVQGITANISFTNNLIDSSDFTGQSADPVLQGATGRLWLSNDGRMRLELQSDNGDAQVVVDHDSFWVSDPTQNVVYEGTLPGRGAGAKNDHSGDHGVPTVARIQSLLGKLMGRFDVSGAIPTNVGGQSAYRVSISPKHDGGLLGSAQIAWDAVRGVPLQFGIYARGSSTPVLDLKATHIGYGAVPASDLNVSPPAGAKVVKVAQGPAHAHGATRSHRGAIRGTGPVAAHVPFTLVAPHSLVGLPLRETRLLTMGGSSAAMVAYGRNLGGVVVIESRHSGGRDTGSGAGPDGLSLPTVSIDGATGTELSTALGTIIHFTRNGVDFTVLGSVPASAAEMAARGL